MFPNFIIIGSKKCASSSLHNYLGQHPEIYTSRIKETGFFSYRYSKGMDFYASHFEEAGNKKIIGESTPTYCFLPYVAERIKKHFPDIKLILCLRNPLERAYSDWLMQFGLGTESFSFDQAMDISKKMLNYTRDKFAGPDGAKYWMDNEKNYSNDEYRPRIYIIAGLYAEIIKLYLKHFKREQIKIVFFDEVMNRLDSQLSDIFQFLGANPDFIVPDKESINFYYDRKFTRIIIKIFGPSKGRYLLELIPKDFKYKLKKKMKRTASPKLTREQRIKYWDCFKDDVAEVEKLLNVDLSRWNPANNVS